jgi:osmotically-inducible protein OsmY
MDADDITASGGSSIELWLSAGDEQVTQVTLQRRVWEELREETVLAGADLRVELTDRVAVLDGTVDHYLAKAAAERAARRVEGICGVESCIQVRPRATHNAQTDADLAAAATRALDRSTLGPPEGITVRVESGVITLGGVVRRVAERIAAEDAVSPLPGVTDIRNEIAVRPATRPEHLGEQVREAVQRQHARHVAVELRGDTVVLRGRVRSLAERDGLEHTVWTVPGVAALTDEVEVAP